MLRYMQMKCRRCVLFIVRQCLRVVFLCVCVSVTFSSFWFLSMGKATRRNFTNLVTNFFFPATWGICRFCSIARSVYVSGAQGTVVTHGPVVLTSLHFALLQLKKKTSINQRPVVCNHHTSTTTSRHFWRRNTANFIINRPKPIFLQSKSQSHHLTWHCLICQLASRIHLIQISV